MSIYVSLCLSLSLSLPLSLSPFSLSPIPPRSGPGHIFNGRVRDMETWKSVTYAVQALTLVKLPTTPETQLGMAQGISYVGSSIWLVLQMCTANVIFVSYD